MALPKKKNTLNTFESTSGKARQQELIDMIGDKTVYLPKGIYLDDLDGSVFDFIDQDMEIFADGKKIPVFYMTKENWAEFTMTWKYANEDGNIIMPFVTVRRSESPVQGTNENIKYRISQNKKFVYTKVPVYENGVFCIDIYKTPQPIPIDMTYEVQLFTHYMLDLNLINEKMQYQFSNGQVYVNLFGYYIPMKLDDVSDESTMNDFDGNRFYCQAFTIKLQGFIQDTENFEVVKGLRRIVGDVKGF